MSLNLTDRNISALPFSPGRQQIVRDTELAGFFLLVGARTKTFMVQGDLRRDRQRRSLRIRIGDAREMSARDARAVAKVVLGQIAKGIDPRDATRKAGVARWPGDLSPDHAASAQSTETTPTSPQLPLAGPTLREAWSRYLELHLLRKERAASTIDHYRDHMERLLVDWLDRPLVEFCNDPREVADRHEAITKASGPVMADSCLRSFRAIFNHARKTSPQILPFNPAIAVDWNPQTRRDTALGAEDLPDWFEQVARLENPIRRDFHLVSILTGSRPEALKNVRWRDIDLRRRTLHIPRPKGGARKAFDIPLSPHLIRVLARLRRIGPVLYPRTAEEWVFPSDSPTGHLVEHGELRTVLSHWGNDLRQTYRTLGQAAGVPELDMHLLMNHSVSGVNAGYITRAKLVRSHLRLQQTRLSRFIMRALFDAEPAPSPNVRFWLRASSQAQLNALLRLAPDEARAGLGARSVARKLDVQVQRCLAQDLPGRMLEAPSRRRVVRAPTRRERLAALLDQVRAGAVALDAAAGRPARGRTER